MVGAGLLAKHAVERGLDPGAPADYDLFEETHADIAQVPGSLAETLDALEADHAFLTKGGVFSEELVHTWISWKRRTAATSWFASCPRCTAPARWTRSCRSPT